MENSNYQKFKRLHEASKPFLLPNAWDAGSASAFAESGYEAVGTSSAAVASALGYRDGERLSFDELAYVAKRICRSANLPVTIDLEGGYSRDAAQICANVERLAQIGVVGINFEDSVPGGEKKLSDAATVAETIEKVRSFCLDRKIEIFINLRTDAYLFGVDGRFEETLRRIEIYEAAGVDGIFIPGLKDPAEMARFCRETALPVNVMCLPDLPSFEVLAEAGVKRISMGPFMYEFLKKLLFRANAEIREAGSFQPLFAEAQGAAV